MTIPNTTHFKETQTPSGKKAIEAFCAVWEERAVAICAPSIEALKQAWQETTLSELPFPDEVQLVWIVQAGKI